MKKEMSPMKRLFQSLVILSVAAVVFGLAGISLAQETAKAASELSARYEELTSPDFIQAVAKSGGTCIIPVGILEKHGPHLPLGTDLLDCRELSLRAAAKEYTIVFPQYYFGQIFEAKHQPGTIAYSTHLMLDLLQETCDELSRNGIKTVLDGHAGEEETSTMLAHRPDLVHMDRADDESGEDEKRLAGLKHAYTGIWWYASQPNHYRGYGAAGNKEMGETMLNLESGVLAEMIRSVKADTKTLELQKIFFEGSDKPLETKPAK
jgi:creatinine amidohydrolase